MSDGKVSSTQAASKQLLWKMFVSGWVLPLYTDSTFVAGVGGVPVPAELDVAVALGAIVQS